MRSFCWFTLGFVMCGLMSAATFFAYKAYCPDAHTPCKCSMVKPVSPCCAPKHESKEQE